MFKDMFNNYDNLISTSCPIVEHCYLKNKEIYFLN